MEEQLSTPDKLELRLNLPDQNLITNRVADLLFEAIISGRFQLGQKLIEEELSSMLNVSRTPIRQALHILKIEGLVDLIPRRGAFVSQLTQKDAEELYGSLGMVESYAAEQLVSRRKTDLSPLEGTLSNMSAQIEKTNLKGVIQANLEFHHTLVKMGKNERLVTFYQRSRNPTRIFQSIGLFSHQDWMESLQDHRQIVAAIRGSDKEAAVQLCRRHNLKRCQRVISHLSQISTR